ncbi:hypothetical protein F5144DRAFT_615726 [Chaetomium tenue]|uniref:Uncharacterized protein n=1 Tax=Chaetomium tenue TaxID=1854479 RepID=A0ACB7NUR2_9PEZI|nr:hypothetical protein F5144DRAFT_615726 [Chaetomium globosum]
MLPRHLNDLDKVPLHPRLKTSLVPSISDEIIHLCFGCSVIKQACGTRVTKFPLAGPRGSEVEALRYTYAVCGKQSVESICLFGGRKAVHNPEMRVQGTDNRKLVPSYLFPWEREERWSFFSFLIEEPQER